MRQTTSLMNAKCLHIANIVSGGGWCNFESSNRVYDSKGLCPTIPTRYDNYMTGFKILVYERNQTKIGNGNRQEEKQ